MALDIEHAAIHEAAHAVALWLVGWNDALTHIQMRRPKDGGAEIAGMKADFPPPDSAANVRSALLVLFAGSAASAAHFGRWMNDIDKDWMQAARLVTLHLKAEKLDLLLPPQIGFKTQEANSIVQQALARAKLLVNNLKVKATIDAVADLLLNTTPGPNGLCIVSREEVADTCNRVLGTSFRLDDASFEWLGGQK